MPQPLFQLFELVLGLVLTVDPASDAELLGFIDTDANVPSAAGQLFDLFHWLAIRGFNNASKP